MLVGLILAGADNDGLLKEISDASNEALIPINGKPMITYMIESLQKAKDIERIVVVGPKDELQKIHPEVEVIQNQGSILDNLSKGLTYLQNQEFILILTSDIPMITQEALTDFIRRCSQRAGDVYYPINSKETSEAKFPGVKRTYIRVKDGTFTGGNVFLVRTEAAIRSLPKTKDFIAMRKKPLKLVAILGLSFIIRFLTKTLTIRAAENRMSQILGLRAVAIISPYAEIGVDIDKPEDLHIAEKMLAEKVL